MSRIRGFTLVEIVIYVGIMGLVMSALMMFAVALGNNRDKAYSASEVEANLKIITDQISQLVHEARGFDEPSCLWDSDQGRLVLFLDVKGKQPAIISLVDGRVIVQLGSSPTQIISSRTVSLERLRFSRLSDNQIGLELTIAYGQLGQTVSPEKFYKQTIKTAITLRN